MHNLMVLAVIAAANIVGVMYPTASTKILAQFA
jgi:hypothetical protein